MKPSIEALRQIAADNDLEIVQETTGDRLTLYCRRKSDGVKVHLRLVDFGDGDGQIHLYQNSGRSIQPLFTVPQIVPSETYTKINFESE